MKLIKIRIGDVISIVDEKNRDDCDYPFYGININKEFMPSVANTDNVDRRKYKVVRKNRFVFSGMQTGRDNCIRISIYTKDEPILVSPAYITFEINSNLILPIYFFMFFNSKEKDRYGAFLSDSSVRSNLDWDRFCDIELDIPPIDIQKKYVDVYNALVANQKAYENGLDDLKFVCDAYIEDLRKKGNLESIGKYTSKRNEKNVDNLKKVLGISKTGFIKPKIRASESLQNYNVFYKDDFVFSPPRINIGSIGLYRDNKPAVCSPIYEVFFVDKPKELIPEYLYLWVKREEFFRYTDFMSIASVRNNFDYEMLSEIEIPVPSLKVQQSIVDILEVYETRKDINEKLKQQIKEICPILIKGSLEA